MEYFAVGHNRPLEDPVTSAELIGRDAPPFRGLASLFDPDGKYKPYSIREFGLDDFRGKANVVLLFFPSVPSGWLFEKERL